MATVKSVTIHDDYPNGDLRERRYKVTITRNDLTDEEYILSPVIVPESDDGSAAGAKKLASLADIEAGSGKDIVSQYQDQNDYDRISLGRLMTETDVDAFYAGLPLFKAMETRGGANANQRRAYLGVSSENYTAMANRFNDVEGIAFFLDDHKDQIWEEIPPEFE